MIERREVVVAAEVEEMGSRVGRFLEDQGYEVTQEESGLSARPRGRSAPWGGRSWGADRIVCGWACGDSGNDGAPRTILCVSLHRKRRWLSTGSLARLHLEALADALIAASQAAVAADPEARVRPLRNLVRATIGLNVLLAFLLLFFLGTVLGLTVPQRLLAAGAVALLDTLAISSFAALVIQGTRAFMGR
ncbi:MAG TPA: hypothetical protein ENK43_12215 [Planctomycetes bacterium]|nr:hypothetical protein [Planctomycetota bacterium]